MNKKNKDLHGSAPDNSKAALLIIDMINDFNFPDGETLFVKSLSIAENILALKQKVKEADIPVIYVNDNFGRWKSNFNILVDHCIHDNSIGKPIAKILRPDEEDYFVLKPKHSGFYSTTLDLLLEYLNVETLILTGITSDICIFFTANDAYMRDYKIIIPSDCTTAISEKHHLTALENMSRITRATILPFQELDLKKLHQ
jgi:nicotinamidase-related amidase